MFKKNKIFNRLFTLLAFGIFAFPAITAKAYTPFGVNVDGHPITHFTAPGSLVMKVEQGAIQDDSSSHQSIREVYDFCQANPGGSPGSGSGGCSLSPFIREANAESPSSNGEGAALVKTAWNIWKTQGAKYADTSFMSADLGTINSDINVCNVDQFIDAYSGYTGITDSRICGCVTPKPTGCTSECLNPVIFDPNGDIIGELAGFANRYFILASASPVYVSDFDKDHYVSANIVVNGICLDQSPEAGCKGVTYKTQDLTAIVTHELGHALGLGHTQVNPQRNGITGTPLGNRSAIVPTMYPEYINTDQATLHKDDLVGLGHLYPNMNAGFPNNFCTAEGFIQDSNAKAVRCAEMVVRKVNPDGKLDFSEVIGFVSGTEIINNGKDPIPNANGNIVSSVIFNTCVEAPHDPNCGKFKIQGLELNTTYQIEINPIPAPTSYGSGRGSTIGPCGDNTPQFNNGFTVTPKVNIECGKNGVLQFNCANTGNALCPNLTLGKQGAQ